jgi:hypothetical protein
MARQQIAGCASVTKRLSAPYLRPIRKQTAPPKLERFRAKWTPVRIAIELAQIA